MTIHGRSSIWPTDSSLATVGATGQTRDDFIKNLQGKTSKWKSGNLTDLKVATFGPNTAVICSEASSLDAKPLAHPYLHVTGAVRLGNSIVPQRGCECKRLISSTTNGSHYPRTQCSAMYSPSHLFPQ